MSDSNPNHHLVAKSGFFTGLHRGMSIAAKGMIAAFVIFTVMNVEFAGGLYKSIRSWIENGLSFYYITLFSVGLFVCFWLMFSKHGKIRLGDDDSRPEFSNFSWFAMLFSAGIGIGILFFGVAEPIFYFDNSEVWGYPNNPHADLRGHAEMDMQRAVDAMRVTFFHWGFHGWAFYVLVGLSLAYFGFRKKLPLTLRSALYPLIGDRIYGPWGHAVDLLAVFGTVFGVATSLGLGVSQMAAGLNYLFGIDPGIMTKLVLIAIVSVIATASAVSGVGKGIRILSEWNIWLSIILLAGFVAIGPFQWLMGFFVTSIGDYISSFVSMGFWTATEGDEIAWQGGWTIFYWGWWISWSPFVGVFIARISRGRTIREFMVGVMFVPTTIAFFWLCMFGGNAIWQELHMGAGVASVDGAGIIQTVRDWNLPSALYGTIDNIGRTSWMGDMSWVSWPMSFLATFLLFSWFITSSDSGTLVITTMLSMGDENPPNKFRIIWGLGEGVVAGALLLAGGLGALQTASIAAAFPISFVLIAMIWGLVKSLNEDPSAVSNSAYQVAPDGTKVSQELRA
ncbi:BCCT family transporter [Aliiroseovarius crassostreae]|uniref:BCCT family transporter n=1 Tax=Aliiroseovarius crassostreae TaxID=154981 RepID=UPI0022065AE4|nr:BCCT family transporter [Aliiroseovarius crassostreae]UWP93455.1 BCCT family transporter [Aliiroseovarius crassostreae]UWP99759.1 BCCT family transporter [Aliiroseovarius crassostreae]